MDILFLKLLICIVLCLILPTIHGMDPVSTMRRRRLEDRLNSREMFGDSGDVWTGLREGSNHNWRMHQGKRKFKWEGRNSERQVSPDSVLKATAPRRPRAPRRPPPRRTGGGVTGGISYEERRLELERELMELERREREERKREMMDRDYRDSRDMRPFSRDVQPFSYHNGNSVNVFNVFNIYGDQSDISIERNKGDQQREKEGKRYFIDKLGVSSENDSENPFKNKLSSNRYKMNKTMDKNRSIDRSIMNGRDREKSKKFGKDDYIDKSCENDDVYHYNRDDYKKPPNKPQFTPLRDTSSENRYRHMKLGDLISKKSKPYRDHDGGNLYYDFEKKAKNKKTSENRDSVINSEDRSLNKDISRNIDFPDNLRNSLKNEHHYETLQRSGFRTQPSMNRYDSSNHYLYSNSDSSDVNGRSGRDVRDNNNRSRESNMNTRNRDSDRDSGRDSGRGSNRIYDGINRSRARNDRELSRNNRNEDTWSRSNSGESNINNNRENSNFNRDIGNVNDRRNNERNVADHVNRYPTQLNHINNRNNLNPSENHNTRSYNRINTVDHRIDANSNNMMSNRNRDLFRGYRGSTDNRMGHGSSNVLDNFESRRRGGRRRLVDGGSLRGRWSVEGETGGGDRLRSGLSYS